MRELYGLVARGITTFSGFESGRNFIKFLLQKRPFWKRNREAILERPVCAPFDGSTTSFPPNSISIFASIFQISPRSSSPLSLPHSYRLRRYLPQSQHIHRSEYAMDLGKSIEHLSNIYRKSIENQKTPQSHILGVEGAAIVANTGKAGLKFGHGMGME